MRPLFVSNKGHAMVVDGYDFHDSNHIKAHFLNIFNDGKEEWRNIEDSTYIFYLAAPHISTPARYSDVRIHQDDDGDSLVNFDEIYRFKTNPYSVDSDDDGIDDKTEIMSYTMRENCCLGETDFFIWPKNKDVDPFDKIEYSKGK